MSEFGLFSLYLAGTSWGKDGNWKLEETFSTFEEAENRKKEQELLEKEFAASKMCPASGVMIYEIKEM